MHENLKSDINISWINNKLSFLIEFRRNDVCKHRTCPVLKNKQIHQVPKERYVL